MQEEIKQSPNPVRKLRLPRIIVLVVLLVVTLIALGVYQFGYNNGKDDDTSTNKKDSGNSLVKGLPATGEISKISDSEVVVKLQGDVSKSAIITKETRITNAKGNVKASDVTVGSKSILFTKVVGKDTVATRIVVQ